MTAYRHCRRALLIAAAPLALGQAQAQAAPCPTAGAGALAVGTVIDVASGPARSFTVELAANEGVIVDLVSLKPAAAASGDGEGHDRGSASPAPARQLKLCDGGGALLVPQPGEVFEKGGSVSSTSEGERLRFVTPRAGRYVVSVAAGDEPREVLVRRRKVGAMPPPVVSAQIGRAHV